MVLICPHCNLPMTREEVCLGACPVCEKALPKEAQVKGETLSGSVTSILSRFLGKTPLLKLQKGR